MIIRLALCAGQVGRGSLVEIESCCWWFSGKAGDLPSEVGLRSFASYQSFLQRISGQAAGLGTVRTPRCVGMPNNNKQPKCTEEFTTV